MNPQIRRLILDLGPLAIFVPTLVKFGIFPAVAAFMVAIVVALAVGYGFERKLSPMPLFTALVVVVLGGLTLYFKNETFIKMKPTLVYGAFGTVLLGGLFFNRLFIKYVFTLAFDLDDAGWRKLTVRWGLFFFFLMFLNEIVWRSFSTIVWGYSKIGMLALTFLFALAQTPLVLKHQVPETDEAGKSAQD
jgi:intracellular septation protein